MASKVWYVLNTAAVSPAWNGNLQDGGTAPTDAACSFGYAPGKLAANSYCLSRLGASSTSATTGTTSNVSGKTGPTIGTGATNTTAGDSFSTLAPYTGVFASGNWTFAWNMRAGVAGLVGRLGMRIWASVNASGASARELTSGEVFTASATFSTTANSNLSYTWAAPTVTLNNEYLFFQLEYQEQTSTGGSNTDTVLFRVGSSITSTNFTVATQWQGTAPLAGACTLALVNPSTSGLISSGLQVRYPFSAIATQWDSNFKQSSDTVNGLTVTDPGTAVAGTTRATTSKSSGKWQFETVFSGTAGWTNLGAGICQASHLANQWLSFDTVSWAYWATGNVYTNSASVDTVSTWTLGDVIGVLVDIDAGKLWFTKNGAVIGGTSGGNPATGSGGYSIAAGVAWYPGVVFNSSVTDSTTTNFGASALTYPVAGFQAWDTTVSDSTSNNNLAILYGSPAPTLTTGKVGNAINFALSGSAYIGFTNTTGLGLPTATSEITVCCWYNSTNIVNPVYCIRNSANGNTVFDFLIGIGGTNGSPVFQIRDDSGAGLTTVTGSALVNDGNWHHIAVTRNSSKLNTLYVDGAVTGTPTTDTLAVGVTPVLTDTFIGRESLNGWYISNTSATSSSSLDDFRIYNRALTTTEINQIATATEPGGVTILAIAQWLAMPAALLGAGSLVGDISLLHVPTLLNITSPLAGAGAASWPTVDPIDQLMRASSALSGAGIQTANLARFINIPGQILAPVGGLTASAQMLMPTAAALTGASAATSSVVTLQQASTALAGASTEASALRALLATTTALTGAGTANWSTIDPTDQLMAAYSALAGSGAFAPLPDVTRLVAQGIVWTVPAGEMPPWPGVGALAALATLRLPFAAAIAGAGTLVAPSQLSMPSSATFAGIGALTSSLNQALAASAALAGAGAAASGLLTLRPITAAFTGVSTQAANATTSMLGSAVLAGAASAASVLSQSLSSTATLAGVGGALQSLQQQANVSTAFAAAGNLTGNVPVLRAAYAAFAGSSALNVAPAQWLASVATLGGAGLLTAAPIQWQGINALALGTSTLAGDVFIPGHNVWSAILNVWPAAGTLAAATTARLVTVSNLAAASTLAGSLTARAPISAVAAGAGQLAPATSSLQLAATASVSGAGALAANYWQLLTITGGVLNGLGGLATTPAQWMFATSALSGAGAIVGDVTKLTGGQLRPIDAVVYLGLSALTAQTTQLLQGLTAWSGAGALTPPSVSVIEPVTLSPAGQGSMAASAALRMSAAFAAAGVGQFAADLTRFTPGVQQGSALLTGASLLVAASSQSMATNLALAGQDTMTAGLTQGMAAGAFWSGTGTLLSAEGLRLQARSVLAGSGLLQVDVLTPRGLAALFAAAGSLQASSRLLGSLVATQAGASSLAARTTGVLATQSLLSSASQLTVGLTAFEQVAGTLAAAGYSAAYLGQIQLLHQQILFGIGVLSADLNQTSIRVVTATIIGHPSESGVTGRKLTAATVTGQDPRTGIIGRKPTAAIVPGQDPRTGIIGQGDFVTLH